GVGLPSLVSPAQRRTAPLVHSRPRTFHSSSQNIHRLGRRLLSGAGFSAVWPARYSTDCTVCHSRFGGHVHHRLLLGELVASCLPPMVATRCAGLYSSCRQVSRCQF